MPIFNYLPVAFPWYDNIRKQNRYKQNVEGLCDYKLIGPRDALLPFQFYKPSELAFPGNWYIREVNSQQVVADITPSLGFIRARTSADGLDYFYYNGEALTTTSGNLNLNFGFYEAYLVFNNGAVFWSEMFHIPDISFSVSGQFQSQFLRLEWWNETDLPPILYNNGDNVNNFRNVAFLETFVHASEPEIQVDTEKDGNNTDIPTFEKGVIPYRISHIVPDFLKVALVIMQMHDHVRLTTPLGIDDGEITDLTTDSQVDEGGGGLSTIDILFQQDLAIIKKGCNNKIDFNQIPGIVPILTSVITSGGYLNFKGTATANTFISIYGAVSQNATYNLLSNYRDSNQLNAGSLRILVAAGMGYTWFKVRSYTLNQDFGLSNAVQKT
jgi:hypothetical protein